MRTLQIEETVVRRLHVRAKAEQWNVPIAAWTAALESSAARAVGQSASARELERYLDGLHLEDLALACACAEGSETAWEHFVLHHRPALYRAADLLDPSGGARELADSLYAELFGVTDKGRKRESLFLYFHGRSSLATWLRSVLAQRHVDRFRAGRRLEPLPDVDALPTPPSHPDDREHAHSVALVERALRVAVARLDAHDRLRLACYYVQNLTLAEIGRLLGEHEATTSRHLARTRQALRLDMERRLHVEDGLSQAQVTACLTAVMNDAGAMDLGEMLDPRAGGKKSVWNRSRSVGVGGGPREDEG